MLHQQCLEDNDLKASVATKKFSALATLGLYSMSQPCDCPGRLRHWFFPPQESLGRVPSDS